MASYQEISRQLRRPKNLLRLGAAVVVLGVAGDIVGEHLSSSPDTCLGPEVRSKVFNGDQKLGVTSDQRTWRLATLAVAFSFPAGKDFKGLVFGFRNPDSAVSQFVDSEPVPPPSEGSLAAKFLIGPGDVQFDMRIEAKEGTAYCKMKPDG